MIGKTRPTNITVSKELLDVAKELGEGNVSRGIRVALSYFKAHREAVVSGRLTQPMPTFDSNRLRSSGG